jgi:pyridoxine kinase
MGDNGKLYIPEDEVPEYKSLLREADLILPNQFEAEYVLFNIPFFRSRT